VLCAASFTCARVHVFHINVQFVSLELKCWIAIIQHSLHRKNNMHTNPVNQQDWHEDVFQKKIYRAISSLWPWLESRTTRLETRKARLETQSFWVSRIEDWVESFEFQVTVNLHDFDRYCSTPLSLNSAQVSLDITNWTPISHIDPYPLCHLIISPFFDYL